MALIDKNNYIKPDGTLMSPEEAARKYFLLKGDLDKEAKSTTTVTAAEEKRGMKKINERKKNNNKNRWRND